MLMSGSAIQSVDVVKGEAVDRPTILLKLICIYGLV